VSLSLYEFVTFDVFWCLLASFGHLVAYLYVLMYYHRRILASFGVFWVFVRTAEDTFVLLMTAALWDLFLALLYRMFVHS